MLTFALWKWDGHIFCGFNLIAFSVWWDGGDHVPVWTPGSTWTKSIKGSTVQGKFTLTFFSPWMQNKMRIPTFVTNLPLFGPRQMLSIKILSLETGYVITYIMSNKERLLGDYLFFVLESKCNKSRMYMCVFGATRKCANEFISSQRYTWTLLNVLNVISKTV